MTLIARLDYQNERVRVKALKDIPRFVFGGVEWKDVKAGEVLDLPRLVAMALEEEGYIEPLGEEIDLRKLKSIVHGQYRMGNKLKPLKPNFYQMVLSTIERLESRDPKTAKRMRIELLNLLERRLKILMELAFARVDEDVEGAATIEEKLIYRALREIFDDWRRVVLGVREGG